MKADAFLDFNRDAYLAETDRELNLPKGFSAAQIAVESNNDPTAISPVGAMGLSQVMPKTLGVLSKRAGRTLDPFNEADSLYIHREVMRENLGKFKNADDAARAYNGGWTPGTWNNPETSAYVPKIRTAMGTTTKPAAPSYSADAFLDAPDDAQPTVATSSAPSAVDFLNAPDEPAATAPRARQSGALLDAANNAGIAVNQGLRGFAGLFGADNAAAKFFQGNVDTLGGNLSQDQVDQSARDAAEIEATDGFANKFLTGARQAAQSPLQSTAKALGYMAPTIATGAAGAAAGLGRVGLAILNAVTGSAQGAGAVKTGIYDAVINAPDDALMADPEYAAARQAMPEAEAKAAMAERLQAYAQNGGKIAIGAGVGALTGVTGAESGVAQAMSRPQLRAQIAKEVALLQIPKKAVVEGLTEVPQEGLENLLSNTGAASGGADIDPLAGVPEAMGQAAVMGPVAGAAGAGMGVQASRARLRGLDAAPVDATTVLDVEASPAATLALPAPKITVDSRGNARRDGEPGVADEAPARVIGTTDTSPVRDAVRAELQALGYDATPRATPTPITVDAEGTARTDADTEVREPGVEPAARVVGRADVDVKPRVAEELRTLGYDGTPRVSPTPISVDPEGNAALQGDTRTPSQANDQRYEAEAAKLHPKSPEARAEYVAAQRQREMGYEARMRDLAEKANAKRAQRSAGAAAPAAIARAPKDWRATAELGVVSKANADGSVSYFFASQPEQELTVAAPGKAGARSIRSVTKEVPAQSALLRAALTDGPVDAGPNTLNRTAVRGVQGTAVDRFGVTRLVGRFADRAKMAGELNRMAAKTAEGLLAKAPVPAAALDLARAAIAANPRKAVTILRGKDGDAMLAGLHELAPTFEAGRSSQAHDLTADGASLQPSPTDAQTTEPGDAPDAAKVDAGMRAASGSSEEAISLPAQKPAATGKIQSSDQEAQDAAQPSTDEPTVRRAPRGAGRSAAAGSGNEPIGRGDGAAAPSDTGKPQESLSQHDGGRTERGLGQPPVGLDEALIERTLEARGGWQFHALKPSGSAARAFHASIQAARGASASGAAVAVYPEADYAAMRLFLSGDALTGFAIKSDGDIVSVFNHPRVTQRGAGAAMVGLAARQGGTKLDAFDTVLPEIYSVAGFRAVARLAWNDEHAPAGWDYQRFSQFNGGRPSVVFMVFDADALAKGALYDPADVDIQEVTSYEAAQRAQDRAISGRDDLPTAKLAAKRLPGDQESLRQWGGETVFKNRDGSLRTLFHGTAYEINKFELGHTPDGKAGAAIFATISPEYASDHYAELHRQVAPGGEMRKKPVLAGIPAHLKDRYVGAHVYAVHIRAENPFNFRVKTHREALLDELGLQGARRDFYNLKLIRGDFKALETKAAMDGMKARGFDSFYVSDHPDRVETMGIGVFSANQIRFALDADGAKDAASPTVRRAARNIDDGEADGAVESTGEPNAAPSADQDAIDAFNRDLSRDAGRPVQVSLVANLDRAQSDLTRVAREKLGSRVVFYRSEDPLAPGGGVTTSAPGVLFVHADERAPGFIVGHEMLHELRRAHPDIYDALHAALADHATTLQSQKAKIEASYGREVDADRIAEENIADVAGLAFADPAFWARFSDELNGDVGKLKQFFRWVGRWLTRATSGKIDLDSDGGLQQAADRMLDDVARAYAEVARRSPEVRSLAADLALGVRRSQSGRRATESSLAAWAREAIQGRGPYAVPVLERPTDALRIAGVSWKKPVMLEAQTLKRHILPKHQEITPELIGRLPALLEAPRMVAENRGESGFQVLVDARDGDGNPVLVALKPHDLKAGGQSYAITGIATMFGKNESMKFVADALREGRVKYMSEEGLKRLEAYRVSKDALPITPEVSGARIRQPASRSTTVSVLAGEALAKFRVNPQGPWRQATVAVEVPEVEPGANLKFSPRSRIADELDRLRDKGSARANQAPANERNRGSVTARAGVAAIRATAPVTATVQAANKVIDKLGEEMARLTGVKALGEKAVAAAERAVDAKSSWTWLEKVKQGVVADYGLPEEYLDAKLGKQVRENKLMREAKGTLDRLSAMTPDQLAVAYQWLQEKPDTARERELIGKLPADQQDVMRQMKGDIDKLSREALALGLINQETYDRNAMAYVHRSYAKYEAELSGSQAIARQRAQRLKGDQFKGRGMEIEASLERVRGELPENLKGMKVEMLEKRDANGRLTRREYLVQGAKRPASLADYTSAGIWEVRDAAKNGNLKVWRDFSLAERQRMGEIEDARYGFARTMLQGVRDVETSRFLKWAGQKYAKATDAGLEVVEISGAHAALGSQTYTRDQWVKVPDTKIKGTQVHRYGALAGKFVPAVMYSDLTGVMELRNGLWDKMLGAWKISKTALSPGVHVNNVMSNFIMADLADVGVNDIRKALQTIVASKAGDAAAVKLIERYDDSGAESGSFASNEIKTSVIEPLLKQIAESEPEAVQRASLAQVVSLAVHGKLGQAAIAATKTLPGRAIGGTMNGMLKAYQSEDAVFRLAKFMNELDAGKTDMQAGKAARDAFLNYDINAPWVRAARRSVLPFVSFTYRVVPLLAKAVVTKPWKIAKYAALAEALSMLTYAVLGDAGDEEKEERLLPEEMQGSSLGIPRMIRMPWNDRDNDPLWLDIRRWLPAGDLTETSNSKASVPLPSYLSIGGPLSLLIDFYSNTDWRGEKIVKSTDTAGEVVLKVSDVLAKFALPNLPVPGLGFLLREVGAPVDSGQLDPYAWAGIERGLNGAKNGFGKDIQAELQVARALGIKLDPRRLSSDQASIALDAAAKQKQITTDARAIGRKVQRGQIPQEEGQRRIAREIEKLKGLEKKTRERLAPIEP